MLGPVDSNGKVDVVITGATAALLATVVTTGIDLGSLFDDCAE